jgi:hypothetical protein
METPKMSTRGSSFDTTKSLFTSSTASLNTDSNSVDKKDSNVSRVWQAIKKHAKEHHESVNAAYATYYGQGRAHSPKDWEAIKKSR